MIHKALSAALVNITADGMASYVVPIGDSYDLFNVEDRGICNASPQRRSEFAAGRAAARGALGALAIDPVPIPRASDRRPIWPQGIIGSISHAEGFAAAIVGHDQTKAGVGLDMEGAAQLKKDVRKFILTPEEADVRNAKPFVAASPRCKVSFAAKEALFKAVYPITKRFFGFQDARVDIDENGSWTASLFDTAPRLPAHLTICSGRWARVGDLIITTICIVKAA